MRPSPALSAGVFITALCLCAQTPDTPPKDAQINQAKGMPPRTTPAEYQAQVQAGKVTIAAEFKGHSVPTMQGPLSTEDYVVVETALFGPPEARLKISADEFSLRINERKSPVPSQPFGMVFRSLKDPEWAPPASSTSSGSKTKLTSSGKEDQGDPHAPPPPVVIPVEVRRAMEQRVRKASLPLGDRALPQAGLLFFPYSGKTQGLRSIELIYSGPAGKASLSIQP